MLFMLSTVSSLLTYNNSEVITYGGYPRLLRKWIRLHFDLLWSRVGFTRPVPLVSLATFALACVFLMRVLWQEIVISADEDGDGKLSLKEIRAFLASLVGYTASKTTT